MEMQSQKCPLECGTVEVRATEDGGIRLDFRSESGACVLSYPLDSCTRIQRGINGRMVIIDRQFILKAKDTTRQRVAATTTCV